MAVLRWGASTDPGQIRDANEDTFVAEPMVFAVADGMGGHRAGEVASAFAASILRDRFRTGAINEEYVAGVVAEANTAIFGAARANSEQTGMGTTLTALTVLVGPSNASVSETEERFALLNVGDSRTYRFRHDKLVRVTVDHSYVQELVVTGHITEEEARTHPRRNIVTRALGIDSFVRPDIWSMPIVRGDRFILCSDGLVDEVPDHEIADQVRATADPQLCAERLVAMANRHGGRDNITVVVVDVLEGEDPPDPTGEIEFDPTWAEGVEEPPEWADDNEPATTLRTRGNDSKNPVEFLPPVAPAVVTGAVVTDAPRSKKSRDRASDKLKLAGSEVDSEAETQGLAPPKRRLTIGTFLFAFALAVIATITVTLIAVHARSGYFVGFQDDNVVVYKGQPGGVLWFDPTVNAPSTKTRNQLDKATIALVEQNKKFDTATEAAQYLNDFVIPTTTTTTTAAPTTTSTTAPTTTTGVTSTTIVGP
jgi:PPM family protein phosphatase